MKGRDDAEGRAFVEDDDVEDGNILDEGVYVGVEDDNDTDMEESDMQSDITEESNPPCDVDFHGLADIWKEMTAGLESTRVIHNVLYIPYHHAHGPM